MKTLSAKRIAAVVAGAALLGVGLAFAGPITFQNVPIISNSGQPVVQIVIGSKAQPWDGVTAANIAAAIGNLAYTSVPVTASVNTTQAQSVLKVSVSSPSYTLSNQQVWLNESGVVGSVGGSYVFSALIGSVLNGAVILNSPQNTKTLQGASSTQYAFPESHSLTTSPAASPYTNIGFIPISTSVTASNNGGGVQFTTFTASGNDNIMQVTASQFPSLLSNYGAYGESTYLWLTGFPVFDQGTSGALVNQFQLLDASGAWQATFSSPIQNTTGSNSVNINAAIRILGQNYTILTGQGGSTGSVVSSSNSIAGGKLKLASSLVPLQTIYVGHNITSGPWTVQLQDLGQPTSGGQSPASIAILYNNVLTNTSSIFPGNTIKFNVTGKTIFVDVNTTFAGLYAYQKWAKMQLYTQVFNVTDGKVYNLTTNPGWYARLLWTNTSSSSLAQPRALQSIIIYNTTPVTLSQGQSFNFIQNPQVYKLTFLGDTLGASSFDALTVSSGTQSSFAYTNLGATVSMPGGSITNITEPAQELTVTSQIPNAFSYVGSVGGQVLYDLTTYKLNEVANGIGGLSVQTVSTGNQVSNTAVTLFYNGANAVSATQFITATNPLLVTVSGYTTNTASSPITQTLTFTSNSYILPLGTALWNVTGVQVSRALPGTLSVAVNGVSAQTSTNSVSLATLTNLGVPALLYTQSGKSYEGAAVITSNSVIYNQQNGQPTNALSLTSAPATAGTGVGQYFQFSIGEVAVPSNTAATDNIMIGIDNNSAGVVATPMFQLNYSPTALAVTGQKNNVSYGPSNQGSSFNVQSGFRTEKGSKVASITPTLVTLDMAKLQDMLQFTVSTANTVTSSSKSYKLYGPYTVGQATNIANVSIGPVNASIKLGAGTTYAVSGIQNLTATPSVTTATQPVWLKNLTTTPLVVLDSQANPGSNLILIGSGYVNTLSSQLQAAYNISITSPSSQVYTQSFGTNRVLIAGYNASQTNAAGNSFIQQLYAQAT